MRGSPTTTGSQLPERWGLPPELRDGTGVIFASAFPGYDRLVDEVSRFEQDHARRERLRDLEHLRERISDDDPAVPELEHMIHHVQAEIAAEPYEYDRRFIFKVLSMGHSQLAEYIGARGPNTHINAACASTTQAVALAEDWIRLGRCDRVVIVAGDDVTSDALLPWIGTGFLAIAGAIGHLDHRVARILDLARKAIARRLMAGPTPQHPMQAQHQKPRDHREQENF